MHATMAPQLLAQKQSKVSSVLADAPRKPVVQSLPYRLRKKILGTTLAKKSTSHPDDVGREVATPQIESGQDQACCGGYDNISRASRPRDKRKSNHQAPVGFKKQTRSLREIRFRPAGRYPLLHRHKRTDRNFGKKFASSVFRQANATV